MQVVSGPGLVVAGERSETKRGGWWMNKRVCVQERASETTRLGLGRRRRRVGSSAAASQVQVQGGGGAEGSGSGSVGILAAPRRRHPPLCSPTRSQATALVGQVPVYVRGPRERRRDVIGRPALALQVAVRLEGAVEGLPAWLDRPALHRD